jgi:hypothetical protein
MRRRRPQEGAQRPWWRVFGERKNALLWSYLALAVAGVGCFAAFMFLPGLTEGWRAFFLNMGTEIVGIGLVIALIDTVIRRREERQRKRYRSIALQQLHLPLKNHLRLLSDMYKASVERKLDSEIASLEDLFSEDYFEQITYFNAMGPSGASSGVYQPPIPWFQYLKHESDKFREDLERIVDKYAMHLDPDTLDLVEQLANSAFINDGRFHLPMVVTSLQSSGHQGPYNHFMAEDHTHTVRDHTRGFTKVVGVYNKEAPDDRKVLVRDKRIWADNVAPAVGSSRALYRRSDESKRQAATDRQTDQGAE